MFTKQFRKIATLTLGLAAMPMAASFVPSAAVSNAVVTAARADELGSGLVILLLLLTTSSSAKEVYADTVKAESLIDQAYMGSGEKLELIATASGIAMEDVANRIVALHQEKKISADHPVEMRQVLELEFSSKK